MASTGSFAQSIGALGVASAATIKVGGELINYGEPTLPPTISPNGGLFFGSASVSVAAGGGGTLYVTVDGAEPTRGSPPYTGTLVLEP